MAGLSSRSSRFSAFLSSFAIQAGFNYDGFQNLGFAAALLPALNEIYEDEEARNEAFRRHLDFFSAHPYLTTFSIGAVIKAEEERAAGSPDAMSDTEITRFKKASGSVLGSVGDRFFWAGMLPFAAITGLIVFLFAPLYGALALLVLYNIPHLLARAEGIRMGYESGPGMLPGMGGKWVAMAILWIKRAGAVALGMLIPHTVAHPETPGIIEASLLISFTAAAAWAISRRWNRPVLLMLGLVVGVALYCVLL
jgi:mannose/fructose/N-acetylgalactosamine-specific phosphotransferase system component IID